MGIQKIILTFAIAGAFLSGCSAGGRPLDPDEIADDYGLSGAYIDKISTENGFVDATIVPTTLDDGRRVQFVIPHKPIDNEHQVFMRDGVSITPVELADKSVKREEFINSEPVIQRRSSTPAAKPRSESTTTSKNRSLKDEALIVGGSAGAGAAIGAVAGGKKGAAIGAISGGVAGLVYDLATRKKG